MTPVERWNTDGVFPTYSAAGMVSIATRRRSRGRVASGHRRRTRPTEAFLQVRRAFDIVGPLDRTGSLPQPALIEVSLQELAHQLLAPPVQLAFEVALTHLLGFGRTEEGLGLSEGGLGCCTRCVAGGCGVVGHGSHRSTLPQPLLRTSREPRRRCGHRWDVSFPRTTPYQNTLRMSRGGPRRRETRARRRRDQAERLPESSAWRRWPEAVPGQRAPKRDPPRA